VSDTATLPPTVDLRLRGADLCAQVKLTRSAIGAYGRMVCPGMDAYAVRRTLLDAIRNVGRLQTHTPEWVSMRRVDVCVYLMLADDVCVPLCTTAAHDSDALRPLVALTCVVKDPEPGTVSLRRPPAQRFATDTVPLERFPVNLTGTALSDAVFLSGHCLDRYRQRVDPAAHGLSARGALHDLISSKGRVEACAPSWVLGQGPKTAYLLIDDDLALPLAPTARMLRQSLTWARP
jgi:hypothetical protein